tara:strand:- start:3689 stop:5035 length:1347 start_codon:yes stop_codon:yes gene_type:complete
LLKIKIKTFIFYLIKKIFKFSLLLNFHLFYAYLIFKKTQYNFSNKNQGMIVFDRINSDMSIVKNFSEYDVLFFSSSLQYRISKLFLDEKIMSQKSYFELTNEKYKQQKISYEKHLLKIVNHLKKFININLLFVANCNYYEHQSWANVFKKLEIPVVVYSKESVLAPGRSEAFNTHFSNLANQINNITKILVYGKSGYKQYIDTNLVQNQNIVEVGSLKTDRLFEKIKNTNNEILKKQYNLKRKEVTLFAFPCGDFPADFNIDSDYSKVWQGGYWAPTLWNETLSTFIELSKSNTNYKFFIKTKSFESSQMIIKNNSALLDSDIEISHEKELLNIYNDSKLIIGFNSTVILEMLVTDLPIFIPKWAEAINPKLENMMILNKICNAYNTLESQNQMFTDIASFLKNDNKVIIYNSRDERDDILSYHLYKVDGNVKKRILQNLNFDYHSDS